MKRFLRLSVSLILAAVCLFSFSISAFAFDDEYISNVGKWYNEGEVTNLSNKVLSGQLRYVLDKNNACAYFYLAYSGCKGNYKDKDVSLEFKISNSSNSYAFSVSKSGIKNNDKNIYVDCDFENVSAEYGNGRLFVGFEMKNKIDRSLKNKITCTFNAGSQNSCVILDGLNFDMYVESKTASQKNSATKSRNEKSHTDLTSKSAPKTTKKHTSKSSSKSTKFVPKHKAQNRSNNSSNDSGKNEQTKFSASGTVIENDNKSAGTSVSDKSKNENTDKNRQSSTSYVNNGGKLSYSKQSKLSFKIAAILAVLGVVGLCYGLFSKDDKKSSKDDNGTDNN